MGESAWFEESPWIKEAVDRAMARPPMQELVVSRDGAPPVRSTNHARARLQYNRNCLIRRARDQPPLTSPADIRPKPGQPHGRPVLIIQPTNPQTAMRRLTCTEP